MQKLGTIGSSAKPGSLASASESDKHELYAMLQTRRLGIMPPINNMETDVKLSRQLWSAWKETGKPRHLHRLPTAEERTTLEARAAELKPWIVGFHQVETDEVMVALSEMYAAFPSLAGVSEAAAIASLEVKMKVLVAYPLWAISKVCERIRTRGYVRTDGERYVTERHWPPSDPEIIDMVRRETKIYRDAYDNALGLLNATTEPKVTDATR
jgi:hypothetical protein